MRRFSEGGPRDPKTNGAANDDGEMAIPKFMVYESILHNMRVRCLNKTYGRYTAYIPIYICMCVCVCVCFTDLTRDV